MVSFPSYFNIISNTIALFLEDFSQTWSADRLGRHGNDGPWSTFTIGFGTPPRYSNVLISTTSYQPWFVAPQGCTGSGSDCSVSRGSLFSPADSSTWQPLHNFTMTDEVELGYTINGEFGYDALSLGLNPAATNLSNLNNPIPSWIANLKSQGTVKSLSWAYTAGSAFAKSTSKDSFARLSIGGYDASLFTPSNVTFNFANTPKGLLVALQSIQTGGTNVTELLPDPIIATIDSGVSHLWLPPASCQLFVAAFHLTSNSTLGLYLIDERAHQDNLARGAGVRFALSDRLSDGPQQSNATVVLPYGALDLELTAEAAAPGGGNATARYFPLRQAANATQYTLGRAFLQHAYIIADYERGTFSVNQALVDRAAEPQLRAILPPAAAAPSSTGASGAAGATLPTGAILGIVIGVVALAGGLALGAALTWRRRRRRPRPAPPVGELKGRAVAPPAEVAGGGLVSEADGQPDRAHAELAGKAPPLAEMPDRAPAAAEMP